MLRLDHIAVAANTLAEGTAWVEAQLGVTLAPGGQHPLMATHNRLLGLADDYLEVITINPDAPAPPHPRWFDLDRFSGAPRLTNWIVACDDIDEALAAFPLDLGVPLSLARGDLNWRMAVPTSGNLPYDNAFPALIQWAGTAHPAKRLPDCGLRLTRLEITHPKATEICDTLAPYLQDSRIVFEKGAAKSMRAQFDTANGPRVLG